MRTKLIVSFLFSSLSLFAQCDSYFFLGSKEKSFDKIRSMQNSVVWQKTSDGWSVSKPYTDLQASDIDCTKSGYILLNNGNYSYKTPAYLKKSYYLKKGWNYLHSYREGIDVIKTFGAHAKNVEFVYTYDERTKVWAGYSPSDKLLEMILSTRILGLKSIEPNRGFYVHAKNAVEIDIESIQPTLACQKLLEDKNYGFIIDSGLDDASVGNKEKTLLFKSRYLAHFMRGIYDDTRVMFIYPKITSKSPRKLKYGPAEPKTAIEFTKEYEGKSFYMFSYKEQKCYEGLFPSRKMPPIAVLKEIN